jgi:hypothetical protein
MQTEASPTVGRTWRQLGVAAGRLGLAAVFATSALMLAVGLPVRYAELRTACAGGECAVSQLRAAEVERLRALGLSLEAYAGFTTAVYLALTVISWTAAGVLAWRRPNEPVALLAALAMAAQGGTAGIGSAALPEGWNYALTAVLLVWFVALVNLLYLFPDGRFVPGWTRWALAPWWAWLAGAFGWVFMTATAPPPAYWTVLVALTLGVFGLGGLAQIYRYRRVSTPAQRQQTKWVVAGFGLLISAEVAWAVYSEALRPLFGWPAPEGLGYEVANTLLDAGTQMLIPVTIGAAILRYRLWDIDIVIQRTLVYSALTALLTGAYFGSVVVLQAAASAVTGQQRSALATVLSTLLIAALFFPLRARVQAFIDRRFFRRKYDAARTLAAFGADLRDDVDLEHLRATLLRAVEEAMQPEHAGLWIALDGHNDIGE